MTGPDHRIYVQCGLRFRSELELALPHAAGTGWDVDVRWGDPITGDPEQPTGTHLARYGPDDDLWYWATRTDRGIRLRFRDSGELRISPDLDEIIVRPDPARRPELLPVLVAGTATAFILALRGTTVLHASAVALDGAVLAFVGQSGRGKSTLAALMCTAGAALVTDDLLAVDTGPPIVGTGGTRELRLRNAARKLIEAQVDATTRITADDRLAYTPGAVEPGPLPLAAVVVPAPSRDITAVETRRLESADAAMALLSFPRVHGWTDRDVLQRDFTTIGHIVNDVPIHAAVIPWGPPFDPRTAEALAALISDR